MVFTEVDIGSESTSRVAGNGDEGPLSVEVALGSLVASDDPPPAVVMRGDDGQPLQGFCPDPTQRHEVRYFSRGAPTKLYRDGGTGDTKVEGYDDITAYLASITDTNESREAAPSEQAQELPPETRIPNAEDKVGGPFTEVWHGTGEPSLLSQSRRVAPMDPEMATPSEPGSLRNTECGHCGASLVAQVGNSSVGAMLQEQPVGLHWRFVDQTAESVTLEMDIREDMRGPAGSLEDGVVASLAEVAGVSAIGSQVGLVATEHLGVSFLAPGWVGPIRATATAQLVGKQDGIAEVRVVDTGKEDQLVAVATVTVQILGKG